MTLDFFKTSFKKLCQVINDGLIKTIIKLLSLDLGRWQAVFKLTGSVMPCGSNCRSYRCEINQANAKLFALLSYFAEQLNKTRANGHSNWDLGTWGLARTQAGSKFVSMYLTEVNLPNERSNSRTHLHNMLGRRSVRDGLDPRTRQLVDVRPDMPYRPRNSTMGVITRYEPRRELLDLLASGTAESWPMPTEFLARDFCVVPSRMPGELPENPLAEYQRRGSDGVPLRMSKSEYETASVFAGAKWSELI